MLPPRAVGLALAGVSASGFGVVWRGKRSRPQEFLLVRLGVNTPKIQVDLEFELAARKVLQKPAVGVQTFA